MVPVPSPFSQWPHQRTSSQAQSRAGPGVAGDSRDADHPVHCRPPFALTGIRLRVERPIAKGSKTRLGRGAFTGWGRLGRFPDEPHEGSRNQKANRDREDLHVGLRGCHDGNPILIATTFALVRRARAETVAVTRAASCFAPLPTQTVARPARLIICDATTQRRNDATTQRRDREICVGAERIAITGWEMGLVP